MVTHGRVELLAHPLSQKYLQMKWNAYGKYFHVTNLLIYMVFLAFVTIYASQLMQNVDQNTTVQGPVSIHTNNAAVVSKIQNSKSFIEWKYWKCHVFNVNIAIEHIVSIQRKYQIEWTTDSSRLSADKSNFNFYIDGRFCICNHRLCRWPNISWIFSNISTEMANIYYYFFFLVFFCLKKSYTMNLMVHFNYAGNIYSNQIIWYHGCYTFHQR